jgi:hypothetical protein
MLPYTYLVKVALTAPELLPTLPLMLIAVTAELDQDVPAVLESDGDVLGGLQKGSAGTVV